MFRWVTIATNIGFNGFQWWLTIGLKIIWYGAMVEIHAWKSYACALSSWKTGLMDWEAKDWELKEKQRRRSMQASVPLSIPLCPEH